MIHTREIFFLLVIVAMLKIVTIMSQIYKSPVLASQVKTNAHDIQRFLTQWFDHILAETNNIHQHSKNNAEG